MENVMKEKTFTASEALTIARVLVRIQDQIWRASTSGRSEEVLAMCRLVGQLRVRIFDVTADGYFTITETLLDEPRLEVVSMNGQDIEEQQDAPECDFCHQPFTADNPNAGFHQHYHYGCGISPRDTDDAYEESR
jgi:hypothetical protein